MKRIVLSLSVLLCTALQAVSAQWIQTSGPGGGSVFDMVEKNGIIFAATMGGIFRSTDNGESWQRSSAGLPENGHMSELAITPDYIYAAGWAEGLFRSADGGITWQEIPIDVENIFILELFAIGESIYIGSEGAGVIRSLDGQNFELINNGFAGSVNVIGFAFFNGELYCGTSGNGGFSGVYRTSLATINWTVSHPGTVWGITSNDDYLFININGLSGNGFYKSADGSTWNGPSNFTNQFFGPLAVHEGTIYSVRYGSGIYKSSDNGDTWAEATSGLKPLTAFSFLPGSHSFFAGFERGVARTDNNGNSWAHQNKGLTNTSVTSLLSDNSRIYATTRTINAGSSEGVYFSDNDGADWIPIADGLPSNPQGKAITKMDNLLILGTTTHGLHYRNAAGGTWQQATGAPVLARINSLLTYNGVVLAGASGQGELYRSVNGINWQQSNSGFGPQNDQIYCLYQTGGIIYAGGFNALYKSTDLGLTWANSFTGIYPGSSVTGITHLGDDLYAVTDSDGIYKSSDSGNTWFSINMNVPVVAQFNAIYSYNGNLYVGGANGVMVSTDHGDAWADFNENLLNRRGILSFTEHSGQLFMGTNETAVWTTDASSLAVPTVESLSLVISPNPSDGTITITGPKRDLTADITIYDMLGKKMRSMQSELNSGIQLDLAPGIYIIKILCDGRVSTAKLVIR